MPPTISARVDEEKMDELKERTDADANSEAIRSAVDFAIRQGQARTGYNLMFMIFVFFTLEAYGDFTVARSTGPFLLAILAGMVLLPKLHRFYQRQIRN